MADEPKGFYNDSGELLGRDDPRCTKRGIVIWKGKGDHWYLDFPDGTERIGTGVKAINVMSLIYYLKETNGNIDKAKRALGWE